MPRAAGNATDNCEIDRIVAAACADDADAWRAMERQDAKPAVDVTYRIPPRTVIISSIQLSCLNVVRLPAATHRAGFRSRSSTAEGRRTSTRLRHRLTGPHRNHVRRRRPIWYYRTTRPP